MVESEFTVRNIGFEFVRQYYTLLNKQPSQMHRFYSHNSSFVHGDFEREGVPPSEPSRGQREIDERIKELAFNDARTHICQIDAQSTTANGLVVQVSGLQCSNPKTLPMRPFVQTFVLMSQAKNSYFVLNDIFRYQDEVQTSQDDETRTNDEPENEYQSKQQQQHPDTNTDTNITANNNNSVDGRLQHMVNGHRSDQVSMNNGSSAVSAPDFVSTHTGSHHHHNQQQSPNVANMAEVNHHQQQHEPTLPVASATTAVDTDSPGSEPTAADSLPPDSSAGQLVGEETGGGGGGTGGGDEVYTTPLAEAGVVEDEVAPLAPASPVVNVPPTYANRLKSRRSAPAGPPAKAAEREAQLSTSGMSATTSMPSSDDNNTNTTTTHNPATGFNNHHHHQQHQHQHQSHQRYGSGQLGQSEANQHGSSFNGSGGGGGGMFGQQHHNRQRQYQHGSGSSTAPSAAAREPLGRTRSSHSPAAGLSDSDRKQVFVGNLPASVTQEALKQLFSKYGVVISVRVLNKSKNQRGNSHYAFVSMDSPSSVDNILSNRPIVLVQDGEEHHLNVDQKQTGVGRGPMGSGGGGPGFGRAGGGPRGGGRNMGYSVGRGGASGGVDRGGRGGSGGFNGGGFQMGGRR